MSEFVVYTIPGSPYGRSVMLALEEKNAPYRIHSLEMGEHQSDAHRQRHPFARIPVIDHGDFRLYETQAILRYIDAVVPGAHLQPVDPRAAGRMDQIMGVNDWYLFPDVSAAIVFQRIIGPVLMGLTPDEAAIAQAMPKARTCIAELDRLLDDQIFLAGDALSLADLMIAPQLDYLAQTPEGQDLLGGTALGAWLARMAERPSMRATLPPEVFRSAA